MTERHAGQERALAAAGDVGYTAQMSSLNGNTPNVKRFCTTSAVLFLTVASDAGKRAGAMGLRV